MAESIASGSGRRKRSAAPKTGYVVVRKFRYNGRDVLPGEKPPVEMFSHPRFESYVSTGLLRMVRQ